MATSNLSKLLQKIPQTGILQWIGLRPQRKADLVESETATISVENGLEADHYSKKQGKRQVTLIQQEHLKAVSSLLGKPEGIIDPQLTRRNLVVSGINLHALKDQQFRIGEEVILEATGYCHPCSRMETNLGSGGYNAMRGHGGITARVIQGGTIKKGDKVRFLPKNNPSNE